jgi:lipopolysaccharide/colanic/teichoic acid biosynthesis glycosyltransferase
MVANGDANGPSLTASGDPRITPFGRLLRSTKVDELAQLLNVLKGEMSLVGPRPEVPEYVALYTKSQQRVLLVKPGITGPAASMYEEELLAEQADKENFYLTMVLPAKLETDVSYSKSVRISTDLKLIFQTISRVIVRTAEICSQRFPASQKQNVETQK